MTRTHKTESLAPTDFRPPGESTTRQLPIKLLSIVIPLVLLAGYLLYFVVSASSLQVRMTPDASISISGGQSFAIGDRYLLLPGEFSVRAEAEGFQSEEVQISVEAGRSSAVEFNLQPLPGDVRIVINPDIAVQVGLDGEDQGLLSQPLLSNVSAGTHQISLDAWLYESWQQELLVPGMGQTLDLEVELVPNWSNISISTVPLGAEVQIDGIALGTTPLATKVEAGARNLQISLRGYRDLQRQFSVEKDVNQAMEDIALTALESVLLITSNPSAATVTLNDIYQGETPIEIELPPNEGHEVALFKAGYLSSSEQLVMGHLENREILIALQRDLASVSLSVFPDTAEILIDGSLIGSGNQDLQLMTKKQLITVRRDGYETQIQEILPTRNIPLHLNFRLLTEEESEWAAIPRRYSTSFDQGLLLFRDAGTVQLGSERVETERRANEARWSASLERAFYVSETQVTNSQFRAYDSDHSSGNQNAKSLDGPNQPVVSLTWQQAALYCNWLSEQEGLEPFYQITRGFVAGANPESLGYRLLTEAEWSWLARTTDSGLTQKYSWGNSEVAMAVENIAGLETAGMVNFYLANIQDRYEVSAPVGTFPVNHRGLSDINGNASEWLHDWYAPQPYPGDSIQLDPLGPEIGELHVIRGANWARGYLPQVRLAYRDSGSTARNDVGFRVARYAK